jgi:predicted ATPase
MLQKIILKNFKCFEEQEIPLRSLNLLTGLNGMGKSTVIQALLLLRQNFDRDTLDKRLSLNGELTQCGNDSDVLYQFFLRSEIEIHLSSSMGPDMFWVWDGRSKGDSLNLIKASMDLDALAELHEPLFGKNFHYLNAERIGPRPYFETSTHAVVNENQIGIRGEFAVNYLAEYQDDDIKIPALAHPKGTGLSLYEQLNAWMSEIRPNTRINVSRSPEMGLVALNYQFLAGREAGNRFRPTNVGFGLSYILPLLVAILSSEPGTLLLLENPEAHLHPRGQAQMGRLLALAAANGIQVIVESHSDHILNGIRVAVKEGGLKPEDASLMFFTGEEIGSKFVHYIETPQLDQNGKLDYRPDGFFDEWDKQLTQLI